MAQRPRALRPELSGRHLLGARLRTLRESHQLSQTQLGELVFCSGHLIGKIEKAERRPQPDLVQRCDEALAANGELLGLLAVLDDPGPDTTHLDGGRAACAKDVELIDAARARYELMYRQVGGIPVSPRIEAFLKQQVSPLLRGSYDNDLGRKLRRAASGLVAVAGICAYDAQQHADAKRHFQRALHLAGSVDDRALAGYVSALMANQALCLNEPRLALQHAEGALHDGRGWISAALRTDLHAMQAKAYAQVGDHTECVVQMRTAETSSGKIKLEDEPAETSYVHPGLLELKNAEVLLQIGDVREAHAFAEASLSLGPSDPRGSFYGYATLAQVLAAGCQAEESLVWAEKALMTSIGMESWRVRDRLALVTESIETFSGRSDVREFLGRAHRTLNTPF